MIIFVVLFVTGIFANLLLGGKLTDKIIYQCAAHLDRADFGSIFTYLNNPNDFTDYCFQVYSIHLSTRLPLILSVILLNTIWIFLALKVSFRALSLPFRFPKNFLSIYFVFPLSLFAILPFSFRDSYLFGLIALSLAVIALIIEKPTAFPLFVYFTVLQILIARTRIEFVPLTITCLILSWFVTKYTALSLNKQVHKTICLLRKLFTSLKLKSFIPKRIKSRLLVTILILVVVVASIVPQSLDSLVNRLIMTNDDSNLLSKVTEYQVNRISRGVDYGSGSDVMEVNEFANASIQMRFTLQFLNNLLTPIKMFPISIPKLLAIFDSFAFILLWLRLVKNYSSLSPSCCTHEHSPGSKSFIVFQCWAIISLLAFSVIVSNGGNAFRYKSYWAIPLTLGLASEVHIHKMRQTVLV